MRTAAANSLYTTLFLIIFALGLTSAHAALPPTLNYQGHLTSDTGVPVDGAVNISFNIYDVEIGGTPLWSELQSVTVNQGVFSVELGQSASPLPTGLFETPLWIGLSVGVDAEMIPRRPVTSTGFAFKAADANTLEGSSASTLDQSAHVVDYNNPHSVTATQVGAADAGTLASHISNTANPHSVSAAQTGAATSADFTTHTADGAAHHLRYNDGEAVNAMGTKSDVNALNHDKYSNANAVAAILAADGAGSALDADLVDGLQASEIIDAAQDEVRTPISYLPYSITQPGSYYLTGNLNGSFGGIDINAHDVTLDLMGFTIDGGGLVNDHGIAVGQRDNITIKNGTVKTFGLTGINQTYTLVENVTLIDIRVVGNGTLATTSDAGIHVVSSNSHIERCVAVSNVGSGIIAGPGSKVINNAAYGNGGLYGIYASHGSIIIGNTARNNSSTAGIQGGYSTVISNNAAYQNTGEYGVQGYDGSRLSDNVAYNNTNYGIYGRTGSNLSGNTAYNNATGIHGGTGARISNNVARNNSSWGIYGTAANQIHNNSIYSNNTSAVATQGGLRVGNDSRVTGNTLDANLENNIYVFSGDSALVNNHVTDSVNGINFTSFGNYYRNNTAAGNTAAFAGFPPTGSGDGGGNASF